MITCPHCGTEFVAWAGYEDRTCKGCQKAFRTRRYGTQKFCSVSCHQRFQRQPRQERNRGIAEMYKTGATLKQIGERFGVTGERARQLILQEERRERASTRNQTMGEQPSDDER